MPCDCCSFGQLFWPKWTYVKISQQFFLQNPDVFGAPYYKPISVQCFGALVLVIKSDSCAVCTLKNIEIRTLLLYNCIGLQSKNGLEPKKSISIKFFNSNHVFKISMLNALHIYQTKIIYHNVLKTYFGSILDPFHG